MSGWLAVDKASVISRHIPAMCQEAAESTYVPDSDLRLWTEMPGKCFRDKYERCMWTTRATELCDLSRNLMVLDNNQV